MGSGRQTHTRPPDVPSTRGGGCKDPPCRGWFTSSSSREKYDEAVLIDEQLQRMKPLLIKAKVWESAVALGERLRDRLSDRAPDRGVCHMDLTLDNVHLIDELIVFDFDSAGTCWRG